MPSPRGLEFPKVQNVLPLALYAVFVAIAADFDFIPKIVAGLDTHRGFTHSLSFALIFSLIVSKLASNRTAIKHIRIFALTLAIYCSHLVLDFFTQGGSGIPLLWPVSDQMFQSTVPLFPAVHHSHGLFNSIHLFFLTFELTYTVLLLWGLSQWKSFRQQQKQKTSRLEQ